MTRFVVAAVAVMALLVGCSGGSAPASAPSGGNLNIRLSSDWGNPIDGGATLSSGAGANLSDAMYDRLVTLSADGKVIPYLASSWTQTPSSVTFIIRKGATCSDGTPVTADVVANSIKRLVSPATKSPYPNSIFGPGPYSVTSDDAARTVTFSIVNGAFNELVYGFTWFYTGIVCPAGLVPGADFANHSYGSGPYVLVSSVHGDNIVMKRRQGYDWGPFGNASSGYPDTLTFKVITNETTAANLLLTGGLDIASITGQDDQRLMASKSIDHYVSQAFVAHLMLFNEGAGHPTADGAVRQALMTAVDPSAWNKTANGGYGLVTPTIVTPKGVCYDAATARLLPNPAADTAKARSILLNDGYTAGSDGTLQKDGKPLTIVVTGNTTQNEGPDYLASQFMKVGTKVDLRDTDYNTWAVSQVTGGFDVLVAPFAGATPVVGLLPSYFSGPFPPAGLNRTRTNDPTLTQDLTNARATALDQRCPYWDQYQEQLLNAHHALPLAAPQTLWFSKGATYVADTTYLEPTSIRRKA